MIRTGISCPPCDGTGAGDGFGWTGAGGECRTCRGWGEVTRETFERLQRDSAPEPPETQP